MFSPEIPELEPLSGIEADSTLLPPPNELVLSNRLGSLVVSDSFRPELPIDNAANIDPLLVRNLVHFMESQDSGLESSSLREHQRDVFHDLYDFIARPRLDDDGAPILRGYIQLPTGGGKTAIFSTLISALSKPGEPGDKRLKSLVLVPGIDLVEQTIGHDGARGLSQFAVDTKATRYTGDEIDLTGDTVVMTYHALNFAVKKGLVTKDMFDLIICDEAHRALGEETRNSLDGISNETLMIGLTATPNFQKKGLRGMFPEQIHSMSLKEGIELDLLAPVQCYAVTSDTKIETLSNRGEYSTKELSGLIENEWRNAKAVEFAKALIQQGKQGLVSCVPGKSTKHAADMAERLSEAHVIDPNTGLSRAVRAVAVTQDTHNRQDIYAAYEAGKIDVLTYVDVLTEGWDSEKAKFLINLRPTTSPVNAVQRLGRILRKTDDNEMATVIEFIDKSSKPTYTFFHALGEATIAQGKVYGPRTGSNNPGNTHGNGSPDYIEEGSHLPDDLLALIHDINHVELGSLMVTARTLEPAPDDVLSIIQFCELHGVYTEKVRELIAQEEIPVQYYLFGRGYKAAGLDSAAQARLLNMPALAPLPEATITSINALARTSGFTREVILKVVEALDIEPKNYRFGNGAAPGIDERQREAILSHPLLSTPEAPEGTLSMSVFSEQHGISFRRVQKVIDETGMDLTTYKFHTRAALGLSTEQQQTLLASLTTEIRVAPEGVISAPKFASQIGCSPAMLRKLITIHDIELPTYKFGGRTAHGLNAHAQERVLAVVAESLTGETRPKMYARDMQPEVITQTATTPVEIGVKIDHAKTPRKVDFEQQQQRKTVTGMRGEQIVLDVERQRLTEAGRSDLADRVSQVSLADDGAGYDILSFDKNGQPKHIEVKTSSKKQPTIRFFISSNELETASRLGNYHVYYVELDGSFRPRVTILDGPLDETKFSIEPVSYVVRAKR